MGISTPKICLPFYKQSIDELIKIHFHCSADHNPSCTAFQNSFHMENLLWEMNFGKEHFLEPFLGARIRRQDSLLLANIFKDICKQLHQQKKYICHRDYHSRNLMIHKNKVRVIDFQDARMGPIQYDLVSLLHDSYVDLSTPCIHSLLDHYHQQASSLHSLSLPMDEFHHIFKLQIIQRGFKVCGSFASFYNLRGDRRYLKYLPKAIHKVYDTLADFPSYTGFRELLSETGCLEKDFSDL